MADAHQSGNRRDRGSLILTFSEDRISDILSLERSLKEEQRDIIVWTTGSGDKVMTLKGHEGSATYATFSPNGARLLTSSRDGTARIWAMDAELGIRR